MTLPWKEGAISYPQVQFILRWYKEEMLNLIAISYENIGPFKDQKISLFFEQGNFLIKAPIGTGKSFLFFDGPSYALYRTAYRNILNAQSKSGSIKLLFESDGQSYFITRRLKQGKSKDSTTSQLFTCELTGKELLEKLGTWNIFNSAYDLGEALQTNHVRLEEIFFKNETDLQQQLNSLLPPQEVFISTIFLLQDAQNIFEMQPAERLEVLKNVFGLMGIDESKELVREKRNELKYQIKAYQDTSAYEMKLKHYLQRLFEGFRDLGNIDLLQGLLAPTDPIIEELQELQDKLSIQNFSVAEELIAFVPEVEGKLQSKQALFQQKKTEFWLYQQQGNTLHIQFKRIKGEIAMSEQQLHKLNQTLAEIKPEQLERLKRKKTDIQAQQTHLETQAESEKFQIFYDHHAKELGVQERTHFSLLQAHQGTQELIAIWTQLKSKIELIDKQLEHLKEKQLLTTDKIKTQLKTLQERRAFFEQQHFEIKQKLEHFEHQTENEARFSCSEINGNCPFIRAINAQHFEQREAQKQLLLSEKFKLDQQMLEEAFEKKNSELEKQLLSLANDSLFLSDEQHLQQEKSKHLTSLSTLKTFLQSIDLKALTEATHLREKNMSELGNLEKSIHEQELFLHHKEQYQQEKIQIENTIHHLTKQKSDLEFQQTQLQDKITFLEKELQQRPKTELDQASLLLHAYLQAFEQLKTLIEEYTKLQLDLKGLFEQEKLLNTLYTVLNKELLLFVLSEYLPVLSEIINSYLSSVVDYQVRIQLKEGTEKLELETKITDEKGERDVKSLSGGQRTILKLVRMLAISSYMKTEMLFLDETVNNLDTESVAKVAQLLADFVKQRRMKFYTITHNSEIQAMNIWDQILEIGKEKKIWIKKTTHITN